MAVYDIINKEGNIIEVNNVITINIYMLIYYSVI